MEKNEVVWKEVSQEEKEKTKKLIVWLASISITMFFAGLVSAYVVQSSDKVWVQITTPQAFTYSTIAIIISSIMLVGALFAARKGRTSLITLFLALTLVFGGVFTYFQFRGWGQMLEVGNYVSMGIINDKGMYGEYYSFELEGTPIRHNGEEYTYNGEPLAQEWIDKIRDVAAQACNGELAFVNKPITVERWHGLKVIQTKTGNEVTLKDGKLWKNEAALKFNETAQFFDFTLSIYLGWEYFKQKGKHGEDFNILLNGEKLDFADKKFYYKQISLNEEERQVLEGDVFIEGQQCKVKKGQLFGPDGQKMSDQNVNADFLAKIQKVNFPIHIENGVWTREKTAISDDDYGTIFNRKNNASSYLWVITIFHFLHIFGGLIYLIVLFIKALNKRYTPQNHLNIKTGGIYWHYLGGLWLFLFFFFQYIH